MAAPQKKPVKPPAMMITGSRHPMENIGRTMCSVDMTARMPNLVVTGKLRTERYSWMIKPPKAATTGSRMKP
eukprot:scaffold315263_cov31-Tisochrysis_lutea.AAC.2